MPKRGPRCTLGYHRVFNLILWVVYTGMQWQGLPVPKDHNGTAEIHYKPRQNIIYLRGE
jgi:transposase